VKTVLKELTFAAMPAMNAASRPVSAIPSTPLGSRMPISRGIASLYVGSSPPVEARSVPPLPRLGTRTRAIRPGMIVSAGMKIFGYAPMSGVRCPADRSLAASARWTSAKFVVQ
jgi:hypothetical protein